MQGMQSESISIDKKILIVCSPEKLTLSSCYHFEGVNIDDTEKLLIFEADKLRYIRIGFNSSQLRLNRHSKFYRFRLLFPQIEESHMVAIKKLYNLLVSYRFVYGFHKFSHFHTREYPLQSNCLVYTVIFE